LYFLIHTWHIFLFIPCMLWALPPQFIISAVHKSSSSLLFLPFL
jgi:hypothetical protein